MDKKTNILIVDDSRVFRGAVEQALAGEEDIAVIGSVRNGLKAMDFIEAEQPDIVSLDVEMPEMNGLATLNAINDFNARHPETPDIGVIMLSAHTLKGAETTIAALEAGAFDFVTKPREATIGESVQRLRRQLVVKIRHFANRRTSNNPIPRRRDPETHEKAKSRAPIPRAQNAIVKAVLVGVSTGGPKALAAMLPSLSDSIDLPILIVQHMPPDFTKSLANSHDPKCRHTVVEAAEGMRVEPSHAYIAPGGQHMVLRKSDPGHAAIGLTGHAAENGCRPSVDVMFRSAAATYGGDVLALVLTGMGSDGAKGLAPLKRAGAHIIVQDEASSVVWGMPGAAVATGRVDEVVPLMEIPKAVKRVADRGARS